MVRPTKTENLLCIANYRVNTGYAWDFIESLFAGVATRLAREDIGVWVAYPKVSSMPITLAGAPVNIIEMLADFNKARSILKLMKFVFMHHIRVIYLTDRAVFHPVYLLLRMSGARHIVVHDHTSGSRTIPRGMKYYFKWLSRRIPGMQADMVVGVSDFVSHRLLDVSLVPVRRVRRIWNSMDVSEAKNDSRQCLRSYFKIPDDSSIIICACRATTEKGVSVLLRAFELMCIEISHRGCSIKPVLIYMGDGPAMAELHDLRGGLSSKDSIIFTGYRSDAKQLIGGADLCVVPSLWDEAFCLAALEPMTKGIPVIASRVGAIPEVVIDGETGLLVDPGNDGELADAMVSIISNPPLMRAMGENGKKRALERFSSDDKLNELTAILRVGFK